jgi:hypothetical protein
MVHSTGINTSDTIRMSCIQDFTRVKPRKNIMWSIEGGSHTVDGVVTFDATRTLDKDDGDRCANNKTILFYRFGTYGVLRDVVLVR